MRQVNLLGEFLLINVMQTISLVRSQRRKQHLPLAVFILLCLNVVVPPVVYAANNTLEQRSAWAIGILGFVALALIIYLFVVVFQPERF
ncbi:potassium-transporting ATPase subunit F [Nostoc sp. MG11]|uniref:potassium-transporting ATPase subunit F n=1 Tax=Nostoc sp. MG11 TaxID=2721166 RepID=UPI001869395C|nr:potassium-transporting ATPase subunit F [Nostoc sp. MG11]